MLYWPSLTIRIQLPTSSFIFDHPPSRLPDTRTHHITDGLTFDVPIGRTFHASDTR
jgi:hypothetical protein